MFPSSAGGPPAGSFCRGCKYCAGPGCESRAPSKGTGEGKARNDPQRFEPAPRVITRLVVFSSLEQPLTAKICSGAPTYGCRLRAHTKFKNYLIHLSLWHFWVER